MARRIARTPATPNTKRCAASSPDLGYYVEFIEYYSQTDAVGPEQPAQMREDFPIWLEEIHSGLDALDKNPAVDPHRVALMGFSLGSFLSLSTGAMNPSQIAAIVEYYGGLPPALQYGAKTMPPTLILHGDKDVLVPVADAHELDDLLTKDKRPHEMKIYEGANHGFNFPELAIWYNASATQDAWTRSTKFLAANLNGNPRPLSRVASLPRPTRGEVTLPAAGEGPKFFKFCERFRMCGATDNRAAQSSLTLTLSPRGARESKAEPASAMRYAPMLRCCAPRVRR